MPGRAIGDDEHRRGAFQRIEKKRRGRKILAAGAQNIGRADIARADAAQICHASHAGEQQAERDRAAEIAEEKSKEAGGWQRRDLTA